MYLVAMGWLYVAVMMSVAEAMHPDGTVMGAMVTFLLYGLLPIGLVLYVMGTPLRRKARQAADAASDATARAAGAAALAAQADTSIQPDAGGHAPGAAQPGGVAAVGKPD
jgi:predicted membrane channel-forming protein YqfA (hemolysin III family)